MSRFKYPELSLTPGSVERKFNVSLLLDGYLITILRYLPKSTGITADTRNMIQCNESMLVDSMIPLDKVMVCLRNFHLCTHAPSANVTSLDLQEKVFIEAT
jgi:hypothetical protein